MPKFGMTYKSPSPWSLRAQSDCGSTLVLGTNTARKCSAKIDWYYKLKLASIIGGGLVVPVILGVILLNIIGISISLQPVAKFLVGVIGVCFISYVVAIYLWYSGWKDLVLHLKKRQFLLCQQCYSELKTTKQPSIFECAQCSNFYSRRECIREWCKFLRSKVRFLSSHLP